MNKEELLKEVIKITEEKKKLHIEDPVISRYWDKLTKLLSNNLEDTTYVLEHIGAENLWYISEIFEDISYIFQSREFILFLEELNKQYPQSDLKTDIKWAKKALNEKM